MLPFSLLIKPASADCNQACSYCFYLGHAALYPVSTTHRMNDQVLERMISTFMAVDMPQHAFGWQGGEPTLMGVDFFRKVTSLQQKHGRPGAVVANGLQTNATLITEELARHLAEYRFLVGVSLDGPPDIHDHYRTNAAGRGSHAAVMAGIERLQRAGVELNILTLVTDRNAGRAAEVYRYLRDAGFLFHQYIPCVAFDERGAPLPFSVTGPQWGDFLCAIFDEWMRGDTRRVSIRHFDAVLAKLVDGSTAVCTLDTTCCQYFVVEWNGDIYPCDFYVEKELRLGNVARTPWEAATASRVYRRFGKRKSRWHEQCNACPHLEFCAGDCLKHRFSGDRHDPRALSALCEGWRRFYDHAMPGFRTLADEVKKERAGRQQRPANPPLLRRSPDGMLLV
jgi:uncharacterized protein